MHDGVDEEVVASNVPAPVKTPPALPWGSVLLLTLIGILNYLDRVLPAILAEPIRRDLDLSDTAIGLINGFGFLLIYAVAGIPIARLADRGRYGLVISASLALWSAMTIVGGLARTGVQLGLSRMGVALGEAGSTPSAHAFISRRFPIHRRAAALSLLTLAAPIGSMAGFAVGGYLGALLGWRQTFIVMGAIGLLLSPVAYFVLARRAISTEAWISPAGQGEEATVRELFKKRSFLFIMAGSSLIAIGGYAATAFAPAFLMRVHHMSVSDAGMYLGATSGALGVPALLLTGWAADRLSRRDPRWSLGVVVIMMLIGIPFSATAFLVESRWQSIIFISINYATVIAYLAPVVVALHRLVPMQLRARASAILLFFSALFGGLGPFLTGALSDLLKPIYGDSALSYALLLVPVAYTLSAICYLTATRSFRSEMVDDD